jgi:hypothetical protein
MEFKHIYSLAKSLAKLAETELIGKSITRQKIKKLVSSDHFGQLIMSKAPTTADKLKIIVTSWFIINKPNLKPEDINRIVSNLYILTVDIYDEMGYRNEECHDCGGDGYYDCSSCDGDGKQDCRYCDGNGTEECYECSGEGSQECGYCDGKGYEVEIIDKKPNKKFKITGDTNDVTKEIKIECVHCDGEGAERCRNCGGSGDFDCSVCEGSGTESCDSCDGHGTQYCDYCGGSGEVESREYYYNIEKVHYLILGKSLEKYIDEPLPKELFDNIEYDDPSFDYYMILKSSSYMSEEDVDDTRELYGMEDNFVIIQDVNKLEDTNIRVHGLY